MSKKINAGDTLTVGDLTDDYLGTEIEVGPVDGFTTRFKVQDVTESSGLTGIYVVLRSEAMETRAFKRSAPVKIIAPPPVVQPDEPTELGQMFRVEGMPGVHGFRANDTGGVEVAFWWERPSGTWWWSRWDQIKEEVGDHQIIVSDPPRWPDEAPEVPERIEFGMWPGEDTHLRAWEWIDSEGDPWTWGDRKYGGLGWGFNPSVTLKRPFVGPWTRGNRAGHHDARVEQDNS